METKIVKGQLTVNVYDLIESLDDEGLAHVMEVISCEERVVANVAAQIVDGWTEAGYHSGITYGPLPHTPLDQAKRLLAKSASEVAKKEIERLERIAVEQQKLADDYRSKFIEAERKLDARNRHEYV